MRNNRNILLHSVIYFTLSGAFIAGLYGVFRWQSNLHQVEQQQDLIRNYKSVIITHDMVSKIIYRQALNNRDVLDLMRRSVTANQKEQTRLRQLLYRHLLPLYQDLVTESSLQHLHLHLPEGISFLRMHRPQEFGDHLFPVRPIVRAAQEQRSPVAAFETGRHGAGFRFVYPLVSDKQLVGSVEISLGFQAIRMELEKLFDGEYILLLNRTDIESKTYLRERTKFIPSPFGSPFLQEQFNTATNHKLHIDPGLLRQIAEKAEAYIANYLTHGNNVSLVVRIGRHHYMVYLMPLKDIDGRVNAHLATVTHSNSIDTYFVNMLITIIVTLILLALAHIATMRFMHNSRQMRETNRLFQATIDALPYPFYVVDTSTYRIKICNTLACNGILSHEMTCHLLTHNSGTPCENDSHPCPMKQVMVTGKPVIVEHLHYDRNGEPRQVEVHGYPIYGDNGKLAELIEYSVDITDRKEAEARLVTLAESDPLTGCHNRRKLYQLLETEIKRARRHEQPLSLLMLDIDHFKQINDRHGHDLGDSVLRHLAVTIQEALRQTDILGRFGGEEFIVLLPESDLRWAAAIATRLCKCLLQNPAERVGPVTVSIGVASLRLEDGSDSLVKRADKALYRAKQNGRNRHELEEEN